MPCPANRTLERARSALKRQQETAKLSIRSGPDSMPGSEVWGHYRGLLQGPSGLCLPLQTHRHCCIFGRTGYNKRQATFSLPPRVFTKFQALNTAAGSCQLNSFMSIWMDVAALFEVGMALQPVVGSSLRCWYPRLSARNGRMLARYSSGCIPGRFFREADVYSFGNLSLAFVRQMQPGQY